MSFSSSAAAPPSRDGRLSRTVARTGSPTGRAASRGLVAMGCGDTCPAFPGKRRLDRKPECPAGQGVAAVRPIRDEAATLVEALIAEIPPVTPSA